MTWRAQLAQGMALMGESIDLMAEGRHDEAIAMSREANRLQVEALDWKWKHDAPESFVASDGEDDG